MSDNEQGKVLVISATDSFLAKSLVNKLEEGKISASFVHTNIKEIAKVRDDTVLMIVFMGEESEEETETLVYLKDMAQDLDCRIILIGDESECDRAMASIPEVLILERFKRPLIMDELTKCIYRYDRISFKYCNKFIILYILNLRR